MEREPIEDYRPAICLECEFFIHSVMKRLTDPMGSCWQPDKPVMVLQNYKVECDYFQSSASKVNLDE